MQGRRSPQRSFLDAQIEQQTSRAGFLDRVEAVVDWSCLDAHWRGLYGKTDKPSHPPLVVFKVLLLQYWFEGLSDEDAEWQCRDRLSFRKFLGGEPLAGNFRRHDPGSISRATVARGCHAGGVRRSDGSSNLPVFCSNAARWWMPRSSNRPGRHRPKGSELPRKTRPTRTQSGWHATAGR